MTRPVNNGWDFVKQGMILQYKEYSLVLIVEIARDDSDDEYYKFVLRPIAGSLPIDKPFGISCKKGETGIYSGMVQLYQSPEYMPMPIGAEWPYIFDKAALQKTDFIWKTQ